MHFIAAVIVDEPKLSLVEEALEPYQEDYTDDCPSKYKKFHSVYEECKNKYDEEDEDIKLLILHEYINKKDGKKIKNKLTLGSVIVSPYANSLIKKQYTKLLNLIFEPNELNMRNNIAHINNENSDYLCLGDTAVLMQLLWDIITEDIFE